MNIPPITIIASFSGEGGVERMLVNLCNGLISINRTVTLLCIKETSKHLQHLDKRVERRALGARHSLSAIPALISFLKQKKPHSLLVAKDRAARAVILAKKMSGSNCKIWIRNGTTLSASLKNKSVARQYVRNFLMPYCYHQATGLIAVSQGVADDIHKRTNTSMSKISVIPNPVISDTLYQLAENDTNHPFFKQGMPPVVVGVGRLTPEKDFLTLIRAVTIVNESFPLNLCLVGGGDTEALRYNSGNPPWLSFAGFQNNPYPYLKQCSLFVLSSRWEGSPNALTEALALGTQVVSTDCPSGPSEVLSGGDIAPLVPVGDTQQMAEAIIQVLHNPRDKHKLQNTVKEYTIAASAMCYADLLDS